jgi:hypothetical protein
MKGKRRNSFQRRAEEGRRFGVIHFSSSRRRVASSAHLRLKPSQQGAECWGKYFATNPPYLRLNGEDRESSLLLPLLFQEMIAGQLAKTRQSLGSSFYGSQAHRVKSQAKLGVFALRGWDPRVKTRGKSYREVESRSGEDVTRRSVEKRGMWSLGKQSSLDMADSGAESAHRDRKRDHEEKNIGM